MARAYWTNVGDHAASMIGHDGETWDLSVTVPFDVIDEVVREVRRYRDVPGTVPASQPRVTSPNAGASL
jgi:hypothetical protein